MAGIIYQPGVLVAPCPIRNAKCHGTGAEYSLSSLPSGAPIVTSQKTGKHFLMPWEDLIRLAQQAGVDHEEAR